MGMPNMGIADIRELLTYIGSLATRSVQASAMWRRTAADRKLPTSLAYFEVVRYTSHGL